ncbi:hypothetical protein BV25DRAFT_1970711 [Artomyces pyxidatus]|uniref:Uncharacterized protein n=1 Tax=Artomyces pyxidatus TaxID=48021 RepID=A0ACB8SNI9_9AGAM|nr:hypothetical protein BV25DRAFT_1970711 [Artomyces pyxidatus]
MAATGVPDDELHSAVNHIFLPPQLPQAAAPEPEERRFAVRLCQIALDAAQTYQRHIPPQEQSQCDPIITMLSHLECFVEIPPDKNRLMSVLRAMQPGDILTLSIRAQNAALIVRRGSTDIIFEAFEVTLPSKDVVTVPGKLECTYPGPGISVPSSTTREPAFLDQLASFLVYMDITPRRDAEKDTPSPQYICELLIGVLRGLGRAVNTPRFVKRIANDALGAAGTRPWRRAPIWFIIRVALQTSLPRAHYKALMLLLHARVLPLNLPSDVLCAMRVKTSRRLFKLEQTVTVPAGVVAAVVTAAQQTEAIVGARWAAVQNIPERRLTMRAFSVDTDIALRRARKYILERLHPTPYQRARSTFVPAELIRMLGIRDFSVFTGGALEGAGHVALADFEHFVQDRMDEWVASKLGDVKACETIKACISPYLSATEPLYTGNAELQSIKILTAMELLVGLDKLACSALPQLRQHTLDIVTWFLPESDADPPRCDFFTPLVLRRRKDIDRAAVLERCVRTRNAEATKPSVFSDELAGSFAADATAIREEKYEQLEELNARHAALIAQAAGLSHSKVELEDGMWTCAESCYKCALLKDANALSIEVHEWPLPENAAEAQRVVFELACPPAFAIWRDAMYHVLCQLGMRDRLRAQPVPQLQVVLQNYAGLACYVAGDPCRRITLASTTKATRRSVHIPADPTTVCVSNGLKLRLCDQTAGNWAAGSFSALGIGAACAPQFPVVSKYAHLAHTVAGTRHTSNEVLATQQDCPAALSLHEHYAFGTLRAGGRLQWLNILREVCSPALTLNAEEVHVLLVQAVYQLGPLAGDGLQRVWHEECAKPEYGRLLIHEMDAILRSIEANWLQVYAARTLFVLASRLLMNLCTFIRRGREVTLAWVRELSAKMQNNANEGEVAAYQARLCEMAATCCATYDVDPEHLNALLSLDQDVSTFIQCAIAVHDNAPPSLAQAPPITQKFLAQHRRLLHSLEPFLLDRIRQNSYGLNDAIAFVWPTFSVGPAGWTSLPAPNSRWLTCETSGRMSQRVHLNLLNGRLLIDGQQLGRLPQEITQHATYLSLFGQKILDVVPAASLGMEFATRNLIADYEVSFSLQADRLIIQAKGSQSVSELVPADVLRGDLPKPLVDDHFHWLDLSTAELQFRPRDRRWESRVSDWVLKISESPWTRSTMRHGITSTELLVDVYSPTFEMLYEQLQPLESREYMVMTLEDAPQALPSVALPRFKLSFFLNHAMELESRNLAGLIVDEKRSSGTMFGLENQLVLRAKDADETDLSQSRRVLIPHGSVRFGRTSEDHHVWVRIDTGPAKQIAYHEYKIDADLGRLVATASLESRLLKCYLHALTSYPLPDPLTGRTGTEEALHELRGAGMTSFQRLSAAEAQLLRAIGSLTPQRDYYSSKSATMQTVKWQDLSPLSQHEDFFVIVQSILEYANKLEVFQEHGVQHSLLARDSVLRERAALRNAIYYPADVSDSSVLLSKDRDHQYGKEKEYAVYHTSKMTQCDQQVLAHCSSPLVNIVKKWHYLGRLDSNQYPVSLTFRDDWIALYDSLRQGSLSLTKRIHLAFSFGAMVYVSDGNRELVPILLSFAANPEFQNLNPYVKTCYHLRLGTEPELSDLKVVIRDTQRPYDYPYLGSRAEEKRAAKAHYYQVDTQAINLAQQLLSIWRDGRGYFWPTTANAFNDYFDMNCCKSATREYYDRCAANRTLLTNLGSVESMLQAQSTRLDISSNRYEFNVTQGVRNTGTVPYVSFRSLLDLRPADVPEHTSNNFRGHLGTSLAPVDTKDLRDLLTDVLSNGSNRLCREYVGELEKSRTALAGLRRSVLPADTCSARLQERLSDIVFIFQPFTTGQKMLCVAGVWPGCTPPAILSNLASRHFLTLPLPWKEVFISYAQAFIEFQRAQRMLAFFRRRRMEELYKEASNLLFDRGMAMLYPDWLLIQIDGNFFARGLQRQVACEMIVPSSKKSTVLQLNMGEGKSSVIVPLVSASLADGTKLVRVIVLKALANQMFQLLVERLCGLANRRVFWLPFSRNIPMESKNVSLVREVLEQCAREGGILIFQPEHDLSLNLMTVDRRLNASTTAEQVFASSLYDTQDWLKKHARDILDESDEILNVSYQLVYTMGKPNPVEEHPARWMIVQEIFTRLRDRMRSLHKLFPEELEYESCNGPQFSTVRILGPNAGRAIASQMADDALTGLLPSITFPSLTPGRREDVRRFMTEAIVPTGLCDRLEEYFREIGTWKTLLLLRGLLAGHSSILVYVLKERRYRVDYGLDSSRTMLAVPYRAKDVPSLRAEFGHPDVTIALTALSYYYGPGLTKQQLHQCFDLLENLDNPDLEYEKWVAVDLETSSAFRKLAGVNTMDEDKFTHYLMPLFSRNIATINFYLSNVVFPKEAKEFPHKLATSGWDLVANKDNVTTGFSGTNDNRNLLPTLISQRDPVNQQSTNALTLTFVLQPRNDHYSCMQRSSREPPSVQRFIRGLVQEDPKIHVLLDVGAQMLDLKNEALVKYWLSNLRDADIAAAVFFDDEDNLSVVTRSGNVERLMSSPFRQQLDRCIVYLDDAHTRGTDLKLPMTARAAVTLGPKVTKDRLLQGCMRMRQLGAVNGQSVMFFAPLEVDRRIRALAKLSPTDRVRTRDILHWSMRVTCEGIEHQAAQWAFQGIDFYSRQEANSAYANSGNVADLQHGWLQQEARTLEEMYEPGSAERTSAKVHAEISRRSDIRDRLKSLGITRISESRTEEEQEREVSHEMERERQVERPPKKSPAKHQVYRDVREFVRTGHVPPQSSQFVSLFRPLHAGHPQDHHFPWSRALLSTSDFATTIVGSSGKSLTEYMRPVHWILSSVRGDVLVAVSPFEVNVLFRAIQKSEAVSLHVYTARVAESMRSFSDLGFYIVAPLVHTRWPVPRALRAQLDLWAGQLYFDDYEMYRELCSFLGIGLEQADAAQLRIPGDWFVVRHDQHNDAPAGFQESPLPVLRELIGLRRKGMTYLSTHLGQVLHSRRLREVDFKVETGLTVRKQTTGYGVDE